MKAKRFCYILFLVSASVGLPFGMNRTSAQVATARDVARQALPSVVILVIETGTPGEVQFGSGFFVAPDVVATNFHVVDGALRGHARIVGQEKKYEISGFTALDAKQDLALVKLNGAAGKPLVLGDSKALVVGDPIFAVGNPEGLEGTFSQGLVSSIRDIEKRSLIQITAPISPGSSGGPVLDSQGRVVGIAMGGMDPGHDLNFAIPVSALKTLLSGKQSLISIADALKIDLGRASKSDGGNSSATADPLRPSIKPKTGRHVPSLNSDAVEAKRSEGIAGAVSGLHIEIESTRTGQKPTVIDIARGSYQIVAYDRNNDGLPDYLRITINAQNQRWTLEFATWGLGTNLAVGTYEGCQRAAFSEGTAGLDVYGSTGCNTLTGTFAILDIEYLTEMGHNKISSFAAKFEQQCEGRSLKGLVAINAVPDETWK